MLPNPVPVFDVHDTPPDAADEETADCAGGEQSVLDEPRERALPSVEMLGPNDGVPATFSSAQIPQFGKRMHTVTGNDAEQRRQKEVDCTLWIQRFFPRRTRSVTVFEGWPFRYGFDTNRPLTALRNTGFNLCFAMVPPCVQWYETSIPPTGANRQQQKTAQFLTRYHLAGLLNRTEAFQLIHFIVRQRPRILPDEFRCDRPPIRIADDDNHLAVLYGVFIRNNSVRISCDVHDPP